MEEKLKDQFVPYKLANELEKLGFAEKVFAKHQKLADDANHQLQLLGKELNCNVLDTAISAPTWDQAFDFFRDKFDNLYGEITQTNAYKDSYTVYIGRFGYINEQDSLKIFTYKEAREACLKKLIELCYEKD